MMEFNKNLQMLSSILTALSQQHRIFAMKCSTELAKLISAMDQDSKGYLIHTQLSKFPTNQFLAYLSLQFQPRVSYSSLASFLQSEQNLSTSGNYDRQGLRVKLKQINNESIQQYISNKYLVDRCKGYILSHIQNYMATQNGIVLYCQFEQYCHSQKLPLNPRSLFSFLSGSKDQIQINFPAHLLGPKNVEVSENKLITQQKIQRMRVSMDRLACRVDKFGSEWL